MKKVFLILMSLSCIAIFAGTTYFLYEKSTPKPVVYETDVPLLTDIVRKTVATGEIVPRREIDIKSQVSGVVDEIFVEAGSKVKNGDLIAKIRIIPNVERLSQAESQLEKANINYQNATVELNRQKQLFNDKLISEFELNKLKLVYNLMAESVHSAKRNLIIVKEGASEQLGQTSNLVKATMDGMILDVPVKVGTFIRETNNFNDGTTIVNIANMNDMIFEGSVDESEVGKIHEGMELLLNIGAMEQAPFTAKLEYISPKGFNDQGTIKFEIKAAVHLQQGKFIRAGYSANADIVLDKRINVLAVNEGLLQFDAETVFVEVESSPQVFSKQVIEVGLSDGINIEILSGLTKQSKMKKPS